MQKRQLTHFGMAVKKRLVDLGMTQVQLAEMVGTSKNYLNLIMYGERSGKKYIRSIVKMLKLDPKEIKEIA
ncbi:MAG: helix-turn-helix transcriptional regulator [Clostridia bacterium]|nr:helix-turn-helix transcriptional regulator [Clostridia bacterium]MDD4048130.1 helix-turn-helix transcriptional regulator [Clostridia bacterium]